MRLLAVALLVVIGWPAPAAAAKRIAVMPVTNLSGYGAAGTDARRLLALELPRAGYEVVTGEPLDRILARHRVRYLESVGPDVLDALLAELDAEAVLFSTVLEYGVRTPSAALSARIVAAGGRVVGTAIAGLTPDDTTGPLGLGRVSSSRGLLERTVERVVSELPRAGATSTRTRDPRSPARMRARRVVTYRAPALRDEQLRRVCLLPLLNTTTDRLGPRIVSDLLTVRMRGLGMLEAVPPAELRAALLAERIYSLWGLDPERMRALGRRLGTPLFLQGTLREYRAAPSVVELEITVVDAEKGRVVWTSTRRAEGAEYRGLLELGALTSPAILADQVVAEMLEALTRA